MAQDGQRHAAFNRQRVLIDRMIGNVIETHEHKGDFKGDFVTRLGKRHARA
jgi:hypothetical protein